MQKIRYTVVFFLLVSICYGQTTYMEISVASPKQSVEEDFKVFLDSYNTSFVTFPIDRVEKRELLSSGYWGAWETTQPVPLGYDGSRYFFTTQISRTTQIRFAEDVSGGTAYSNVLTMQVRDSDYHWIESRVFDENGQEVAKSRQYFDEEGNGLQSQSLDIEHNEVFASESLYDNLERAVGRTLDAPIGKSQFEYNAGFATVNGERLEEVDWKASTPSPLDKSVPYTLGHYYGSNPEIANTDLPYSVMNYYNDGSGEEKTSSLPGNHHFLESNKTTVSKSLPMFDGELRHYVAIRDLLLDRTGGTLERVVKQVIVDGNNHEAVSYYDNQQNVIATALSGGEQWPSTQSVAKVAYTDPVEIHIPKGQTIDFVGEYSIKTLETRREIASPLSAGFYLISNRTAPIRYRPNYYAHSYSFYNDRGQLIASMSPKGVQQILDNEGISGFQADKLPYTTYYY
ncbi:MAG: hypothetical protein AAFO69_10965, partial [Bacteroidota bacterium]